MSSARILYILWLSSKLHHKILWYRWGVRPSWRPAYAFDLLNLEGSDLRSRPLVERRKLLAKVLKKAPDNIRFSEELQGTKEELLQVARQFQLEGLIAQRRDSVYESGPTQRCLVFFIREGNSYRRCPDGC
jgi:ATP dependent DNA ligase domain